jgi:hypothetical protein
VKNLLVFEISDYCSGGGWDDFLADFDSIDEAISFIKNSNKYSFCDYYQIVDTESMKIIKKFCFRNDEIVYIGEEE